MARLSLLYRLVYFLKNLRHRLREWTGGRAHQVYVPDVGLVRAEGQLEAVLIRASGERINFGTISRRVVTNNGVGFMIDAFQNLVELEAMNWHASGTGAVAEAVGDSALGTEVESRASGTQSEPASNQYRTVATISYTATRSITEHGIFSANAAGVLLDRSVFTAIGVVSGDSIQFTYTLTLTAGS